jgi:hypothetical protein
MSDAPDKSLKEWIPLSPESARFEIPQNKELESRHRKNFHIGRRRPPPLCPQTYVYPPNYENKRKHGGGDGNRNAPVL